MAKTIANEAGYGGAHDVAVPEGYTVTAGATHRTAGRDDLLVSPVPVLVTAIGEDVDTRQQTVTLTWPRGAGARRRWVEIIAPRQQCMSARSIVELAAYGLPVASTESAELVRWIRYQEAILQTTTTARRQTRRLGWHGDAFLLGRHRIGDAPEWRDDPSDGVDQWVDALRRSGTLEGQTDALWRLLGQVPAARLAVAASAASPCLRLLGQPGFALELARRTGQGKTTVMRLAMALWGDPGDGGLLRGWDATRVGVERLATAAHDVTVWLDDTKRAARQEDVDSVIYDVTSGTGRLRGAPRGAAPTASYRSNILTTGESSVTGESRNGGIRGRVLSWQGEVCPTPDLARAITDAAATHHGHIAPVLVEYLRTQGVDRDRWRELAAFYASTVPAGHPTGDRLSGYAATLAHAGELLAAALGAEYGAHWWLPAPTWAAMLRATETADRAVAGLEEMLAHIGATGAWGPGEHPPTGGWAGSSTQDGVFVLPGWGKAWAARAGYSWPELVQGWRDRGWCGSPSVRRFCGNPARMLEILPVALRELEEPSGGAVTLLQNSGTSRNAP